MTHCHRAVYPLLNVSLCLIPKWCFPLKHRFSLCSHSWTIVVTFWLSTSFYCWLLITSLLNCLFSQLRNHLFRMQSKEGIVHSLTIAAFGCQLAHFAYFYTRSCEYLHNTFGIIGSPIFFSERIRCPLHLLYRRSFSLLQTSDKRRKEAVQNSFLILWGCLCWTPFSFKYPVFRSLWVSFKLSWYSLSPLLSKISHSGLWPFRCWCKVFFENLIFDLCKCIVCISI